DRSLADSRRAHEQGIVGVPFGEHVERLVDFFVASHHRIELPAGCREREILAELAQLRETLGIEGVTFGSARFQGGGGWGWLWGWGGGGWWGGGDNRWQGRGRGRGYRGWRGARGGGRGRFGRGARGREQRDGYRGARARGAPLFALGRRCGGGR